MEIKLSKLNQIEELRKDLVKEIIKIIGLPVDEITVDISLTSEGEESEIAIEARDLGWYPNRQAESAWYTTEIPQGGSTTVFVK